MKIIYLATPFSYHPKPLARLEEIHVKVATLMRENPECLIVSAILYYGVLVPSDPEKAKDLSFWYWASSTLVKKSDEVWVWNPEQRVSSGVNLEVRVAYSSGITWKNIK